MVSAVRHLLVAPEVTVEQLGRAEIDQLVGLLGVWYPALAVGEEAALLSRDYYLSEVALAGEAHEGEMRVVVVALVKIAGELSACLVMEAMESGRVVNGRMTVVSPSAYGKRLGFLCAQIVVAMAQAMDAERAVALAELDNHASRKALEGAGFVLTGILPASDRKPQPDGSLKYVPEGIYVHSLIPSEHWVWPQAQNLTPRCAALLQLLFFRDANNEIVQSNEQTDRLPEHAGINMNKYIVSHVPKLSLLDIRVCDRSDDARGEGWAELLQKDLLVRAEMLGARLILASTSLRNVEAQQCYERQGLSLFALVPAADPHPCGDKVVYGFDALYGVSLVPEDLCFWPAVEPLPPRLREVALGFLGS